MQKLRVCFAGTPEFAAAHLSALVASNHEIIAVYTQPDRPAGRGKKLQASPVKRLALESGLPVLQPASLKNPQAQDELRQLNPDVLVVVAYGLILPAEILDIPRHGCINVHASLLPRWRGAAPIERAILSGDKESGVTIMQMDAGLDTGDMLKTVSVPIEDDDRLQLEDKLCEVGKRALIEVLDDLSDFQARAVKQDDARSTYAHKIEKEEARIVWEGSATQIGRQVRAGAGRSPAYTFLQNARLRIIKATPLSVTENVAPGTIITIDKESIRVACEQNVLQIESIQFPGKTPVTVRDLLNSRPRLFQVGDRFTSTPAESL